MWLEVFLLCGLLSGHCHCAFNLTILHTNDVHARFEQFNKYGSSCSDADISAQKCYGGVARRMTAVRKLREQYDNVLLLDGGDQFQGTLWFYHYAGVATSFFCNLLRYDAMALGNHEFDNGISGVTPFLKNATFPVLSSNINSSLESSIQGLFNKSVVKTIAGRKVGIIGYTTADTTFLSSPGKLIFESEVETVKKETERLKRENVDIIIALGHAGIDIDRAIAKNVEGVDVVVGGHTNTFLYTGNQPSNDVPYGSYPLVTDKGNGDKTLTVQDYTFAKYLGRLTVTFDDSGNVQAWEGNPILLDSSVEEDNKTLTLINLWKEPILELGSIVLGRTNVFLEGDTTKCRLAECNMGNLITDAVVHQNLKHPDGKHWARAAIAIWNGGGIRSPIPEGQIQMKQVLATVPFRNGVDIIEIEGKYLKEIFEHSVGSYSTSSPPGRFLQVSGVRVTYDLSRPTGSRVVSLEVKCAECRIPRFEQFRKDKIYEILVSAFLASGGDGYTVLSDNTRSRHIIGDLESEMLIEYIKKVSPITHGLEGRIQFVSNTTVPNTLNVCASQGVITSEGYTAFIMTSLMAILWRSDI